MNALKIAAILSAGTLVPGAAFAQSVLRLGDVDVVQTPQQAHYRPENTDYDLADQGKTFNILCTVAVDGRMQDCTAQPNGMADQNFVRIGTDNARYFVIARHARDGTPTAGRILSLTCKFDRAGDGVADAAPEQGDRGASSDVAVNDVQ
jgi:hypothetical protein